MLLHISAISINLMIITQLTLGENLADNGGVAASYQAFQNIWNSEELSGQQRVKLPGIDLSPEALFYTSFARTWCSVARPEAAMQKVTRMYFT